MSKPPTEPCKTCVFFSQTYKHDIEREDHAYQMGTCTQVPWARDFERLPVWNTLVSVDRDAVHACHVTTRSVSYPGVF